ncbi:MAG: sulfatase-like hydrolase/transferase [Lachnospiraceae bacterium]
MKCGQMPSNATGIKTIPSVLESHGYRTASFGKTHLPYGADGFEVNNQDGSEMDLGLGFPQLMNLDKIEPGGTVKMNLGSRFPEGAFYRPELVAKNAIEWLGSVGEDNFFLRISFLQPHTPVVVPEPYASMYHDIDFDSDIMPDADLSYFERRFADFLGLSSIPPEKRKQMIIF